jgi:hypothetical protein
MEQSASTFTSFPSITPTRTGGILAAADLNELLDIGNFDRHGDGWCMVARYKRGSSLST